MAFVIWRLFDCNVWNMEPNLNYSELVSLSVMRLKHEIFQWYKRRHRTHPDEDLHKLQELTLGMLGTRDSPLCKTKAAEAKTLLFVIVDLARRFVAKLGGLGPLLVAAGEHVLTIVRVIGTSPRRMSVAQIQTLLDATKNVLADCHASANTPETKRPYDGASRLESGKGWEPKMLCNFPR